MLRLKNSLIKKGRCGVLNLVEFSTLAKHGLGIENPNDKAKKIVSAYRTLPKELQVEGRVKKLQEICTLQKRNEGDYGDINDLMKVKDEQVSGWIDCNDGDSTPFSMGGVKTNQQAFKLGYDLTDYRLNKLYNEGYWYEGENAWSNGECTGNPEDQPSITGEVSLQDYTFTKLMTAEFNKEFKRGYASAVEEWKEENWWDKNWRKINTKDTKND